MIIASLGAIANPKIAAALAPRVPGKRTTEMGHIAGTNAGWQGQVEIGRA